MLESVADMIIDKWRLFEKIYTVWFERTILFGIDYRIIIISTMIMAFLLLRKAKKIRKRADPIFTRYCKLSKTRRLAGETESECVTRTVNLHKKGRIEHLNFLNIFLAYKYSNQKVNKKDLITALKKIS